MTADRELLDIGPTRGWDRRWRLLLTLALLVAGGALLLRALPDDEPSSPSVSSDCLRERGATWCSVPSEALSEVALARLVRGYCPRLQDLALRDVVPQPLALADLSSRPDDLLSRTATPVGRVESGLLGRPRRLAWVMRPVGKGVPWELQVICLGDADRVPALELDRGQLGSAYAGAGRLDLRDAARSTARALHDSPRGHESLGTFRCDTSRAALDLHPGTRFSCSAQLISIVGQTQYDVTYEVTSQGTLRAVT